MSSSEVFNEMSDLVADADDLILSIQRSTDPEVQALKGKVEASIEEIREFARQRISEGGGQPGMGAATRLTLGAGLTLAIVVSVIFVGRALISPKRARRGS